MRELVPSLRKSLAPSLYKLVQDYLETAIDCIFENELLKGIPFIGTLAEICKIGYHLQERNLSKQTLNFLIAFNRGEVSQEKLDNYNKKLDGNPKRQEEELSRVIILLNSNIDIKKSRILGGFFRSYVNEYISWGNFCELTEANQRLFLNDYYILVDANKNGGLDPASTERYQVDRLIGIGLLQNANWDGVSPINDYKMLYDDKAVLVTEFGEMFCKNMGEIEF